MAEQEPAPRAAHDVVVPARLLAPMVVDVQQLLEPVPVADRAGHRHLDVRATAGRVGHRGRVLMRAVHPRAPDHRRPAQLQQPVEAGERQMPGGPRRQQPASGAARAPAGSTEQLWRGGAHQVLSLLSPRSQTPRRPRPCGSPLPVHYVLAVSSCPPLSSTTGDGCEVRAAGKVGQLLVLVEVPATCRRLGRGRCAAERRGGGVDGEATARRKHTRNQKRQSRSASAPRPATPPRPDVLRDARTRGSSAWPAS